MKADLPDLLLLDLAMPGLDGTGVLQQMVTIPGCEKVRVIVISAHTEMEGRTSLCDEIRIIKPEGFRLVELTHVIEAALSQLAPVRSYLPEKERAPRVAPSG